jgi:hypothetical protein
MALRLSSIDDLASSQWSLVTREQLIDAGFSRARIASLIRTGSLRVAGRRVYAMLGSVRGWQQDLMAAVLGVGEGSVASHASAARLWAFVHRPEDAVDVLVKAEFGGVRPGVHRTTVLPDDDITTRDGIACTSFERTLCDCTTLLTPFQLGRVLDDGLRRREVSLVRLQQCALRLDSGPGRRLGVVKVLLSQRDAAFDPGGSASELHVLQVIRDAGLTAPVQQYPVRVGERTYVLDFAWPDRKLFVEYYGLAVHSGASAVAHDNRRLTAMVGEDWRPLVFTDSTSDHEIVEAVANELSKPPSHGAIAHPGSAQTPPSDGAIEQRRSA